MAALRALTKRQLLGFFQAWLQSTCRRDPCIADEDCAAGSCEQRHKPITLACTRVDACHPLLAKTEGLHDGEDYCRPHDGEGCVCYGLQDAVLDVRSRRKLSVHVLGSEKARAAAAAASAEADDVASSEPATNGEALHATDEHFANGTTAAEAADGQPSPAANGSREGGAVESNGREEAVAVEVITDCWAFKRAQEVYAAPK